VVTANGAVLFEPHWIPGRRSGHLDRHWWQPSEL